MGKLHMEVQSYLRQRPDGTFSFPIKYLNATHLAEYNTTQTIHGCLYAAETNVHSQTQT